MIKIVEDDFLENEEKFKFRSSLFEKCFPFYTKQADIGARPTLSN